MTGAAKRGGWLRPGSPLRTARSAAVAGIIFAVFLITALVLLRVSVPARPEVPGAWLTNPGRRAAVAIALNLIPFAGIAFLWFIGVLRDRIGEREDRLFATVFLGSGLLFVGMLFVAAAVAGATIAAATAQPGPDVLKLNRDLTGSLLNVYAMRMAAVFTLTAVTIARRTAIVSRWLTVAGLVTAVVLLVGVGISAWVELLFPAWILALSVDVLMAGRKAGRLSLPGRPPGGPVTAFPLAAAAAGAGVVAAAPGVLSRVVRHQLGGGLVRPEQPGHGFHRLADVAEEVLVAGAQVMLAGLTVGGGGEPVLGAASLAGEPDVAVQAVPGQGVVLVLPELALLG